MKYLVCNFKNKLVKDDIVKYTFDIKCKNILKYLY